MIVTATQQQAAASRRHYTTPSGAQTAVDTYIGTNRALLDAGAQAVDPSGTYPMAYRVSQAPGSVLAPHFHQADQFQVIVGGSGRIGTHPVQALSVHFAGAYSPYGPLLAGSDGLAYLTLRRSWDPGAQYMPQAAPRLRAMGDRRHWVAFSDPIAPDSLALHAQAAARVDCLIAQEAMGAWLLNLPARALHDAAVPVDRFVYLVSGQAKVRGCTLGAADCLFASADEGVLSLQAGAQGASLLLFQFPSPSP